MTQREAMRLGTMLIAEHLTAQGKPGWGFRLSNMKSMLGYCHYGKMNRKTKQVYGEKYIVLSTYHAEQSSEADIRDTILHEIAHARVGHDADAHGAMWSCVAAMLGAKPNRCGNVKLNIAPNHVGTCPKCSYKITRNRLTTAVRTRAYHSPCGMTAIFQWSRA